MPTLDIAADFEVMDKRQSVVLFRRVTASTFDSGTTVENAIRRAATKEELDGLAKTGLVWNVWGVSPAPKVNDVLSDSDSVRWSVIRADVCSFGTRYRLTTIKER